MRGDITGFAVGDGDDNPDVARIKRRLTVLFRRSGIRAGVGMVIADDLFGAVSQLAHQIELDFRIDEETVMPTSLGHIGAWLDAGQGEIPGICLMTY